MANNSLKTAFTFTFIFLPLIVFSQNLIHFNVSAGDYNRDYCPVYVDLRQIHELPDENTLCLYEVIKSELHLVSYQFDDKKGNGLWFIPEGRFPKDMVKHYVLKTSKERSESVDVPMKVDRSEGALILKKSRQKILRYQTKTAKPPKGVDSSYQKSGFIHPLWSPSGEVLTRIQPPDHYHHYGIWGPWTKTHIDDREVDFWNLKKKQGTVRFAGISSIKEGEIFCEIKVKQEHIDFNQNGGNQVAINEELIIRAWNIGNNAWLIDYITVQSTPLVSGIILNAYRYGGGIGFRATEKWTKNNCTVLTSEGKTRENADGTKARWCRVEGTSSVGRSGILFMDYPQNREFPEPMRVWPLNANNNRGDLFFEFCPIRIKSWKMEYGKKYQLKYRLFVSDGNVSSFDAEALWQSFAHPPTVVIEN